MLAQVVLIKIVIKMIMPKRAMHLTQQHFTQSIPTPLAALALGIASLGWCWDSSFGLNGTVQFPAAVFAMCLLGLLLLKFSTTPQLLWQDLAHPILGSVLPTAAMASMVVSVALPSPIAQVLWYSAVVLHIVLFAGFLWHRLPALQLQQLIPGWFVPPIGIVTAVLTCPLAIPQMLITGLFWFGLAAYLLMLPIMLYRLLFAGTLPLAAKPSLAILAAPASLCLASYLTFTPEPAIWLVMLLLALALIMTSIIYLALPYLLRLPFSPAFAAYTFPLVIGTTALFKVSALFNQWQLATVARLITYIAYLELAIATVICSYVTLRFAQYLLQQFQQSKTKLASGNTGQLFSAPKP